MKSLKRQPISAARQGLAIDPDVARLMLRPDRPATLDMVQAAMRHQRELRSRVERSGEADALRIALHLQLRWTYERLRRWDSRTGWPCCGIWTGRS